MERNNYQIFKNVKGMPRTNEREVQMHVWACSNLKRSEKLLKERKERDGSLDDVSSAIACWTWGD